MANMREMNPNLMRAAGFQSAGYQGRWAQQLLDAPMRDGGHIAYKTFRIFNMRMNVSKAFRRTKDMSAPEGHRHALT